METSNFFRAETIQLPVKLTKPFTAILYITFDKQHMEELRHTLHVKDVAEGTEKVGMFEKRLGFHETRYFCFSSCSRTRDVDSA